MRILRGVSRSFYLSLRILPAPIRQPISLAYLLARATDTLADTPEVSVAARADALPTLAAAIDASEPADSVKELQKSFAPLQSNAAERQLILALPDIVRSLASADAEDRSDIRAVLRNITRGQMLDLQRFGVPAETTALQSAAELNEYTYLVAGCVGEFWTRICARKLRRFSRRTESEMIALGVEYGQGLQLTNVLRDLAADLRAGRCYLPADELSAAGLSPRDLAAAPASAEPLLRKWRDQARAGLRSGVEYACAVENIRVRIATALPALIGIRTIRLLENVGIDVLRRPVKITRPEVRTLVTRTVAALAAPSFLRRDFERHRK